MENIQTNIMEFLLYYNEFHKENYLKFYCRTNTRCNLLQNKYWFYGDKHTLIIPFWIDFCMIQKDFYFYFKYDKNNESSFIINESLDEDKIIFLKNNLNERFKYNEESKTYEIKYDTIDYIYALKEFIYKDYSFLDEMLNDSPYMKHDIKKLYRTYQMVSNNNLFMFKYPNEWIKINKDAIDKINNIHINLNKYKYFSNVSPMLHYINTQPTYAFNIISAFPTNGSFTKIEIGYDLNNCEFYILFENNGYSIDNLKIDNIETICDKVLS